MLRRSPRKAPSLLPLAVSDDSTTTRTLVSNIMMPSSGTSAEEGGSSIVPKFAYTEITLGRVVGQGGFSIVKEVIAIDLADHHGHHQAQMAEDEDEARRSLATRINSKHSKYVLKTLRNDLPEEEHVKGVMDLAIEAEFLSVLQHANIISMRAIANTDPHRDRFFVLLDRLVQTLDKKFNFWRKLVGQNSGYWIPCCGYCCAKAPALAAVWKERMEAGRDLARAVQYLHSQGIIYRDLKPDNIGFDIHGTLRIFDFGLAKRLTEVERGEDGRYMLTGNTGSLRYMAPEVANDQPYDLSVDAYSFGILFWQICSLTTPYAGYTTKMHAERVVRQGQRPKPDRSWPMEWVDLMHDCWNKDRIVRPNFNTIVERMEEFVADSLDEHFVPSLTDTRIRAKKRKKKKPLDTRLDTDTRLSSPEATTLASTESETDESQTPDSDIV